MKACSILFLFLLWALTAPTLSGSKQSVDELRAEGTPKESKTKQLLTSWLHAQSDDLLEIIKVLYKGRDTDLQALEKAQDGLAPDEQIELRIALIKKTLMAKQSQ
jgi:hypothetical protein